jgi:hypothetical protein
VLEPETTVDAVGPIGKAGRVHLGQPRPLQVRPSELDEIITRKHTLEQVNDGYRDLLAGKNIRGVVIHES